MLHRPLDTPLARRPQASPCPVPEPCHRSSGPTKPRHTGVSPAGRRNRSASPPRQRDREALIALIRQQDPEAEGELVERYGPRVMRLLRKLLTAGAEADDLFQETFCRALGKIRGGELRDPAALPCFLTALARNLAINHFRVLSRRQTDADTDSVARAAHTQPSQLEHLLEKEASERVQRLINELPTARDRQMLRRFYLADEDKVDLCAELGLDSLHFNRVLYRARERYRKIYKRGG